MLASQITPHVTFSRTNQNRSKCSLASHVVVTDLVANQCGNSFISRDLKWFKPLVFHNYFWRKVIFD